MAGWGINLYRIDSETGEKVAYLDFKASKLAQKFFSHFSDPTKSGIFTSESQLNALNAFIKKTPPNSVIAREVIAPSQDYLRDSCKTHEGRLHLHALISSNTTLLDMLLQPTILKNQLPAILSQDAVKDIEERVKTAQVELKTLGMTMNHAILQSFPNGIEPVTVEQLCTSDLPKKSPETTSLFKFW